MIFIRIKVKGYLKNITENELLEFNEKGIKTKNKISYLSDNVKNIIKVDDDKIILTRDGNDFINTFVFNKKSSSCNYFLKDNNYDVDIIIDTKELNISDNSIYVKYIVTDSNCEYEYKLEMSDV